MKVFVESQFSRRSEDGQGTSIAEQRTVNGSAMLGAGTPDCSIPKPLGHAKREQ
jgi:hypothetical protein